MSSIHPTATVSKECEIGDGAEIGPYCSVSGNVKIGPGVRLMGHVYISGPATIGEGTTVYPFACIGFPGQDFKFKPGDKTAGVVIGKHCILRESTTVHAATKLDAPTTVGDNVLMMCGSHVGHDSRLDDRAILVNGAAMGGHSHAAAGSTMSAYSALHQFGRIGRLAFISAQIAVSTDVPPFCMVAHRNQLLGLNLVGLRRAGVSRDQITLLRGCYRDVFRSHRTMQEMVTILQERSKESPLIKEWHDFFLAKKRPICVGQARDRRDDEDEEENEDAA